MKTLAGIVRAHSEVRKIKRLVEECSNADRFGPPKPPHVPKPPSACILNVPRLLPAALLRFEEGISLTALPQTRKGWASLCRILSKGRPGPVKASVICASVIFWIWVKIYSFYCTHHTL